MQIFAGPGACGGVVLIPEKPLSFQNTTHHIIVETLAHQQGIASILASGNVPKHCSGAVAEKLFSVQIHSLVLIPEKPLSYQNTTHLKIWESLPHQQGITLLLVSGFLKVVDADS